MKDSNNTFLVGIDGGGTGCRVLIADADRTVISQGHAGAANVATNYDLAIKNINAALKMALDGAALNRSSVENAPTHIGLAGVMNQAVSTSVTESLSLNNCIVTDDRPTSVVGALGGEDGHVLSIGTGTIAAASEAGQFKYVGSWGFFIADQASGAWLGRHILDRTLQSFDRVIPFSPLTAKILKDYESDPRNIVSFSLTASPADYATYAPEVIAAAEDGDAIALGLMHEGRDYLIAALSALGHQGNSAVCLAGGVGQHYKKYLTTCMDLEFVPPKESAVCGALQLAQNINKGQHS
jgi:glucosamine kinase